MGVSIRDSSSLRDYTMKECAKKVGKNIGQDRRTGSTHVGVMGYCVCVRLCVCVCVCVGIYIYMYCGLISGASNRYVSIYVYSYTYIHVYGRLIRPAFFCCVTG